MQAFELLPEGVHLAGLAPERRRELEAQLEGLEWDHKVTLAVTKPNGKRSGRACTPPRAGPPARPCPRAPAPLCVRASPRAADAGADRLVVLPLRRPVPALLQPC